MLKSVGVASMPKAFEDAGRHDGNPRERRWRRIRIAPWPW